MRIHSVNLLEELHKPATTISGVMFRVLCGFCFHIVLQEPFIFTFPDTNIAPEKMAFQKEISSSKHQFSDAICQFQGGLLCKRDDPFAHGNPFHLCQTNFANHLHHPYTILNGSKWWLFSTCNSWAQKTRFVDGVKWGAPLSRIITPGKAIYFRPFIGVITCNPIKKSGFGGPSRGFLWCFFPPQTLHTLNLRSPWPSLCWKWMMHAFGTPNKQPIVSFSSIFPPNKPFCWFSESASNSLFVSLFVCSFVSLFV